MPGLCLLLILQLTSFCNSLSLAGKVAPTGSSARSARRLVEVSPTKAGMLMKAWEMRADTMNTMKTVPDGKTGKKLKVVSAITLAGEGEASRRTLCRREFQSFKERALSLASADAGEYPEAKRQLIPQLKIAGSDRGLNAKCFANLREGASTLSMIEVLDTQWNMINLCVSPDTRTLDSIVAAEAATLDELRELCADAGATLRVLPGVVESLAGSRESLGLAPVEGGVPDAWLCADAEASAADAGSASSDAVHEALRTRRTINNFAAELPAGWEASLQRAVEAATYAPNHKRTEPWRFHLLGPEAVRRVCELNAELVAAAKGEEAAAKKLKRWLEMPGWLVVTCVRGRDAPSMEESDGTTREDYAACCCAVQNLCLSLHADGVGTKWTTGPVNFDPRFGEAAGLSAEEYVVGTIWFGEAVGDAPPPPQKRLKLEDVLSRHD
jgi:nitroreductase